jgi:nucleoside-diphosphate-sugar epimerase
MRILVTGSTGFLGSHATVALLALGHAVTATGRNAEAGAKLSRRGADFRPADLGDARAMDALIAEADAVVHCGGLSSAWGRVVAFQAANVGGTKIVVDACERHRIRRLVHISTPSVYFDFRHHLGLCEDAPLPQTPVNAYAASKRAAEDIVAKAASRGLDAVILRPRGIFGPGDSALLPRLLRVARRGWLPLVDRGEAVIDLTYVGNVADAIGAALHAPEHRGLRLYNITNGEPLSVKTLFDEILKRFAIDARLIPVPFQVLLMAANALERIALVRPGQPEPLLTRYTVGILGRSQTLSIEAARRDLHFSPRISLIEGMARTAEQWRRGHA